MNRSLKKFNIVLSNKTTNTIKSELCKLKDRTADEDKCNCVYKINCGDCNKFYLGETGRSVSKRVYEHKYNVTCKNVNSQIFQHVIENNHRIDFSNVSIIHQNSNWKQRKFIESCFTTSYPDSFNRCEEISETILPCIQDICKRVGIWSNWCVYEEFSWNPCGVRYPRYRFAVNGSSNLVQLTLENASRWVWRKLGLINFTPVEVSNITQNNESRSSPIPTIKIPINKFGNLYLPYFICAT